MKRLAALFLVCAALIGCARIDGGDATIAAPIVPVQREAIAAAPITSVERTELDSPADHTTIGKLIASGRLMLAARETPGLDPAGWFRPLFASAISCPFNDPRIFPQNQPLPTALCPYIFSQTTPSIEFDQSGNARYAPNNQIRNSTMQGAAAGSPGTAPTNWRTGSIAINGLSRTLATGTEFGMAYLELTVSGTTTAAGKGEIDFDQLTQIAAATGQVWTHSGYYRLVGGSFANLTSFTLGTEQANSGGTALAGMSSPTGPFDLTTMPTVTPGRFYMSGIASQATVAFVYPYIAFNYNSGVAINFTIRIYAPQLEIQTPAQGGTPSPFYATSGTAYFAPRINYDFNGTAWVNDGYLPEQQHTNLVTASFGQFSNATYWTIGKGTVTDGNASSPLGSNTASTYANDTTSGTHELSTPANISVTSGQPYVFSQLIKAGTDHLAQLTFNLSQFSGGGYANFDANACGNPVASGGTFIAAGGINEGNGVCRVWISATATATGSTTALLSRISSATDTRHPSFLGTGTTILIGEADVIANPFPLSMAPTYGATTTVNADVMSISPLPACLQNPQHSMVIARAKAALGDPAGQYLYSLNSGSANNSVSLRYTSSNLKQITFNGGVQQGADLNVYGSMPAGNDFRYWTTISSGNIAAQAIGLAKVSSAGNVIPSVSTLNVGHLLSGSLQWNSTIAGISAYCAANDNYAFQKASGQ